MVSLPKLHKVNFANQIKNSEQVKKWLLKHGGVLEYENNQYLVWRIRINLGICRVYKNKEGEETWRMPAKVLTMMSRGENPNFTPTPQQTNPMRPFVLALLKTNKGRVKLMEISGYPNEFWRLRTKEGIDTVIDAALENVQ